MKRVKAHLESMSPYSQGRFHNTAKLEKELHGDYEDRTWKERMHYNKENGLIFIPPMQFCNSLKEAAKYLSISIPGKGKSTFTKHFESGVLVINPLYTDTHIDNVEKDTQHVPSDGRRGGTTRVIKHFGIIRKWSGVVEYLVTDETITKNVFSEVLEASGQLIGVGRFRPRNWGYFGTFKVNKIEWDI